VLFADEKEADGLLERVISASPAKCRGRDLSFIPGSIRNTVLIKAKRYNKALP
jgi:hypothetical protein